MAFEAELQGLIGQIYDASLDPSLWPQFLESLEQVIESRGTGLYIQDFASQRASVGVTVNLDPAYLREYEEHLSRVNIFPIRGGDRLVEGRVVQGAGLCAEAEVLRSEYYNDSLRLYDLFHSIGAVVLKEGSVASLVITWRSRSRGAFAPESVAVLEALVPHLRRAVQIHSRLDVLTLQRDAALDGLDRLRGAVILTDERARVLFRNRAAADLLRGGDGLTVDRSGLAAATGPETARLRASIARAGSDAAGAPGESAALRLSRPSGRRDLAVIVSPLTARSRDLFGMGRRQVATFVTDPESSSAIDAAHLRRLYGLTPAEAQLALQLASGLRLQDACDRLSVRKNTGRWHLQRIFEKTCTTTQAELVRLLVMVPPAVPVPAPGVAGGAAAPSRTATTRAPQGAP